MPEGQVSPRNNNQESVHGTDRGEGIRLIPHHDKTPSGNKDFEANFGKNPIQRPERPAAGTVMKIDHEGSFKSLCLSPRRNHLRPGIRGLIGARIYQAFSGGGIPFKSDLLLDYFERQGHNLMDAKENKIGKILPTCASFNGVNQYAYTPGSSPYITGGSSIDIDIWFKCNAVNVNQYLLNCGGVTGALKGFSLRMDTSGKIIFGTSAGDGSSVASQTIATLNASTYYRLQVSWDGLTGGTLSWI